MAHGLSELWSLVAPSAGVLATAVVLDLLLGDPVYHWHPVRLMGGALTWFEKRLRAFGLDGYGGGVALFLCLALVSTGTLALVMSVTASVSAGAAWLVHLLLVYSLLALGDLLHHVWRIESSVRRDHLPEARTAVSALVGRDTDRLDAAACRRAAVESLSENLTDGFVSPLFWYVLLGLPGLVLFKVVSTMDSMVGYRTARYLAFGWCGARLDDLMNFVPARLTWCLITGVAAVVPSYSGLKAWTVGLTQHALLLGPNSGWSEAAIAGALGRRIVGPIWLNGAQVTDIWVGDAADAPLATSADVVRAMALVTLVGLVAAGIGCGLLSMTDNALVLPSR